MRCSDSPGVLATITYAFVAFAAFLLALVFPSQVEAVSFGATALACEGLDPLTSSDCSNDGGPGFPAAYAQVSFGGSVFAAADNSGRMRISILNDVGPAHGAAQADLQDTITFSSPFRTAFAQPHPIAFSIGGQVSGILTAPQGPSNVLAQLFFPGTNCSDQFTVFPIDSDAANFHRSLGCAFDVGPDTIYPDHEEYHQPFEARLFGDLYGTSGRIDVSHSFTLSLTVFTPDVTWTSASGVFLSQAAVPEPASMLLLASGLAGMAAWRRKTR